MSSTSIGTPSPTFKRRTSIPSGRSFTSAALSRSRRMPDARLLEDTRRGEESGVKGDACPSVGLGGSGVRWPEPSRYACPIRCARVTFALSDRWITKNARRHDPGRTADRPLRPRVVALRPRWDWPPYRETWWPANYRHRGWSLERVPGSRLLPLPHRRLSFGFGRR